jgi:FkbM family methyltransferase
MADESWVDPRRVDEKAIACLESAGRGGTFLDLGANVGEVSIRLADRFDAVVAVESHPDTALAATRRIAAAGLCPKVTVIEGAVHSTAGIEMFASTPRYSTGSTVRAKRRMTGRDDYYKSVKTIAIQNLVDWCRPRVIKMDIEGCEYDCLDSIVVPPYLEHVVIEFHGATSKKLFDRFLANAMRLRDQGLSIVYPKTLRLRNGCLNYGLILTHFARREPVVAVEEILK